MPPPPIPVLLAILAVLLLPLAACDDDGTYRDYQLDDDAWEAIHIASWLHDCGKVTTPEYVVDKSTKLETLYDRIHEIRTRFEVLWRDAEIDYHRALRDGEAHLHSDMLAVHPDSRGRGLGRRRCR